MVERACLIAGLDPYVGFIHTDHYNKVSLVFDLIEQYRIWADQTVLHLFSSRKIKANLFHKSANGLTLDKAGKVVLMTAYEQHLDEAIRYHNRNLSRRDILQHDCHQFANQLLDSLNEKD